MTKAEEIAKLEDSIAKTKELMAGSDDKKTYQDSIDRKLAKIKALKEEEKGVSGHETKKEKEAEGHAGESAKIKELRGEIKTLEKFLNDPKIDADDREDAKQNIKELEEELEALVPKKKEEPKVEHKPEPKPARTVNREIPKKEEKKEEPKPEPVKEKEEKKEEKKEDKKEEHKAKEKKAKGKREKKEKKATPAKATTGKKRGRKPLPPELKKPKKVKASSGRSVGRPSKKPNPAKMSDAEIKEQSSVYAKQLKDIEPHEVKLTKKESARVEKLSTYDATLFVAKKTKVKLLIEIATFVTKAKNKSSVEELHSKLADKVKVEVDEKLKSTRGRKPKGKTQDSDLTKNWRYVVAGIEYDIEDCPQAIDALVARRKQVNVSSDKYKTASPSVKAANSLEVSIGHIGKSLDKDIIEDNPQKVIAALRQFKSHMNQAFQSLSKVVKSDADIKRFKEALDVIAEIIEKIKEA